MSLLPHSPWAETGGDFAIGLRPIPAAQWLEGGETDPARRKDAVLSAHPDLAWGELEGSRPAQTEALELFAASPDAFGLILMDLSMPGVDGLTATRALRQSPRGATVPIVALTRLTDPDTRRDCFDAGMNGFLPKPISATGIESIVCLVGHGAYRAHA